MGATTALVEDDTSLFSGIKNLALSYFDTTSIANKHGIDLKKHFDFQTVKGEDWASSVADILGTVKIGDFGEKGKEYMKKAIKGTVAVAQGEASMGAAFAGYLTDFIVDRATEAFGHKHAPIQEQFEEGTWVYIDRGQKVNKLHMREEMASESSMFFDSDETLTKDLRTKMFSPGFYISHVASSNESLVYCYDVENPEIVSYTKIREADLEDRFDFDRNKGMTLIREMYFLRENRDNLKYSKFQVGDEVLFDGRAFSCYKATAETITLQDTNGNLIDADPQACTKGETDHWTPIAPGMFRTAEFTFSIGDFAYREITIGDQSAGPQSTGILTCIKSLNGDTATCVDAWGGGDAIAVDANRLVKPPMVIRRLIDGRDDSFHTFKRSVLKGYATNGVVRSTTNTGICYGFDQTLEFPKEQFIRTTVPQAVATVQKATIMVKDPGPETPVVKGDNIGTIMWVVMGAGAFLLLFF